MKDFLTDGDYIIDLNNVTSCYCTLKNVTYFKKPTLKDYETGQHNIISNIRTFYVGNYFLITKKPEGWDNTIHDITKYLLKNKALRKGSANYREFYSIANDYKSLQKFERGLFPKDLFYPIKQFINHNLFEDDYRISDFYVETDLIITSK